MSVCTRVCMRVHVCVHACAHVCVRVQGVPGSPFSPSLHPACGAAWAASVQPHVCMRTHVYACTRVQTHLHFHVHAHGHLETCTRSRTRAQVHARLCACAHTSAKVRACARRPVHPFARTRACTQACPHAHRVHPASRTPHDGHIPPPPVGPAAPRASPARGNPIFFEIKLKKKIKKKRENPRKPQAQGGERIPGDSPRETRSPKPR